MKKTPFVLGIACLGLFASCKKDYAPENAANEITAEEKALVAAAGFNGNWAEKTADGNFLIEGDIYLSKGQIQEMVGQSPSNNFIVANEEHYRTYNLVDVSSGPRVIKVKLGSGFPAHYAKGLEQALARYNSYNLKLTFQITTGTDQNILITGEPLGTSGGGCILGRAAGFPSNGNPAPGFTLSTSSCAVNYLSTANAADEVIAHEIGHCIGFRHTDYKRRSSCGPGAGESAGSIGAVHIPGTPTNVNGNYNSWMMACTNGDPNFGDADGIALTTIYK
jgi:hypothetical protein